MTPATVVCGMAIVLLGLALGLLGWTIANEPVWRVHETFLQYRYRVQAYRQLRFALVSLLCVTAFLAGYALVQAGVLGR